MGKRHRDNRVATAENDVEHLDLTGLEGRFFFSFRCWITSRLLVSCRFTHFWVRNGSCFFFLNGESTFINRDSTMTMFLQMQLGKKPFKFKKGGKSHQLLFISSHRCCVYMKFHISITPHFCCVIREGVACVSISIYGDIHTT